MCGRFTNKLTWDDIVPLYRMTLNAPRTICGPAITSARLTPLIRLFSSRVCGPSSPCGWGLVPRWWSKKLRDIKLATFNARAETVTTKPFFRDAFMRTRCLIPISGYYEWQDTPGGKQPWYFTARDGSPALTVAGLWDEWKDRETGQLLKSCTMIITQPNDFVAEVHDRMPVLLEERQFEPWLRGEAGLEYLKPPPNDFLQKWPVSKRVNSSRADADDSTLIEKVELAVA